MSILYIRDKNGNFVQMPSVPGKSAYEIAVAKGTFSGTEQEFAEMQVINNKDIIDQITQENIDNWNSAKGMTDEEKEQLANKIDKVELTDDNELIFYSEDKEISRIQLQGGMSDEEKEQLNTKLATKFDDVALNENETNDMQTALDFYSEGKVVKTAYFTGGSGGGSSTSAYISTELEENVMVGTDENFNLTIDFVSPNPGKGTLKVFINDVEAVSKSIGQGESTTTIEGAKFTKGTNRVTVYVIDRVGVMSNSLTFYIRYGSTEISSDFDQYSAYDYGATVRYYFTPTALDTSLTLTFYMSIDGQVQQGVACTSDTRGYYTFPTNLSADNHYCEAYIIDSNGMKSNVLAFNLIILNTNTLVVASDTKNKTIEEGEQLSLDYKAYMKNNTSFITKAYIDNNLVNTGTCNADFNYYRTSSLTEGIHTIKLEVWDVTETYHDYVTWTITVTPSTYEMKQPVNAGAMFIGTAVNKTNTDERKQYFIGQDQEGNEVLGTLTNFAYNSESGWVNDELIISGNSHVEIPIQPLANNARYGFTLDIEFTSKQIGVADAEVLTLWNNETNCGIKITTEKLILQSSNGNKCDLYFTDNERTHVMFIIDRQELKAKIYLNGVMCEAFHLNDYTVDGVAYLDDFTVNSNIVLGGLNKNGYCKIRNLRVYQVALTTDEIINNFISCEIDKGKQRELVEFQKGNDLPTLYVYCDFSGLGKDDKKPCKIVYNSTNVEKYGESFTLNHKQSQLQYQGTSSMAYPIKNYRLNLRDEKGKKWYYNFPGGQGECRFTLKADFMSSGHWTNTGMAKFINDNLYNYKSDDEKSMNPFRWYRLQNGDDVSKYRETINGFPCRLILINDGSTPLNEGQNEPTPGNTKDMGIFNFNNDKDNVTTLGFNSDIFPNCASYEVTANSDTSAGAFMSYGRINGQWMENLFVSGAEVHYNIDSQGLTAVKVNPGEKYRIVRTGGTLLRVALFKELPYDGIVGAGRALGTDTEYTLTITDGYYYMAIYTGPKGKPEDIKIYNETSYSKSDELAYLKESFELRHPDEDDVAEDWGFMGAEEKVKIPTIDYFIEGDSRRTSQILTDNLNGSITITSVTGTKYAVYVYFYDIDGQYLTNAYDFTGVTHSIPDGAYYASVTIKEYDKVIINGVTYSIGDDLTGGELNKEPYDKISIQKAEGTGLKALIDWVDNCTDEEFVADFEQHFHKDYTLRYFCLVTLLGAVDNLG